MAVFCEPCLNLGPISAKLLSDGRVSAQLLKVVMAEFMDQR